MLEPIFLVSLLSIIILAVVVFVLNSKNQKQVSQNEELNTELSLIKDNVSVLKQEISAFKPSLDLAEQVKLDFSTTKEILEEKKNEIASIQSKVEVRNTEVNQLKKEKDALVSENENNKHLIKRNAELEEKFTQSESIKTELENTKKKLELKTQQESSLFRSVGELEEKLNSFDSVKSELMIIKEKYEITTLKLTDLNRKNGEYEEKANQYDDLKQSESKLKETLDVINKELTSAKSRLAASDESTKAQDEKIILLEKSEQRLSKEFENIANRIFKEKTGTFTAQNKTSLDALISPLKDQITGFSKQVNDVYSQEAKERHALQGEIKSLKELNSQMSQEATALTRALKGDNKKQGTWGEVVLERVLVESGLRESHEYSTQSHLKNEDGRAYKPDVIVHLPEGKDVVIDSKMALVAYERFYNSDSDAEQKIALNEHVNAIKTHIKQLSSKDYQLLHGITSLDYVLMFIPVEPAFNAAIESDPGLIQMALEVNIMLVSPNNLMVALRTINNMWRVEYQNQNAQEIAAKAGAIYDKFVGFVEDMKKIGTNLQRAEGSYSDAMKKLSEGRGNLVKRAEDMKGLNISNSKSLPSDLVESSATSDLIEHNA